MAEFPFLPIKVAAFMADTQHLGVNETGAYVLLIFAAWLSPDCGLPDDDQKLARLARCSLREWRRIRPAVMAFWSLMEDGRWHQKHLDKVRSEVSLKSEKARASALSKSLKENKTAPANAQRTHSVRSANQNQNHKYSHGEINTDAEGALAPNGARPRTAVDPQTMDETDLWRTRLRDWRPGKFWSPMWGPQPGSDGCFVPPEVLKEWRGRQT